VDGVTNPRIWLIASANSLDGLPPELISRFQVGGIYFFDVPDEEEKQGIMKLKIAKYKLDPKQPLPKMDDWTGRDVNNCAFKAEAMGMSLTEAGQHVVPLLSSHREQMDSLRNYATGRFLSASKPGVYKYSPPGHQA
jgi:AAA+ superfamily predicted ATPase